MVDLFLSAPAWQTAARHPYLGGKGLQAGLEHESCQDCCPWVLNNPIWAQLQGSYALAAAGAEHTVAPKHVFKLPELSALVLTYLPEYTGPGI